MVNKLKKIKLFLGGYLNSSNAQNINCRSIATYIDKEKFSVSALELYSGNLESLPKHLVNIFRCTYPHKVSKYVGYLWGIYKCDIAYLPKHDCRKWNRFWLTVLRKKSFSTIEAIIDDFAINNALKSSNKVGSFVERYKKIKNLYSITGFMKKYNYHKVGLNTNNNILYLGTETADFINNNKFYKFKNIIFIGNDLIRKGIFDFLKLAKKNSNITFHVVGTGNGQLDLQNELDSNNILNVIYHGGVTHRQLIVLLEEIDLHILPSRSEGFPKVILETAAAGIPSIVYSDYGAQEWIDDYQNGFVADELEDIQNIINHLTSEPELIKEVSKKALILGKQFDWKIIIKKWEDEITKLYEI